MSIKLNTVDWRVFFYGVAVAVEYVWKGCLIFVIQVTRDCQINKQNVL